MAKKQASNSSSQFYQQITPQTFHPPIVNHRISTGKLKKQTSFDHGKNPKQLQLAPFHAGGTVANRPKTSYPQQQQPQSSFNQLRSLSSALHVQQISEGLKSKDIYELEEMIQNVEDNGLGHFDDFVQINNTFQQFPNKLKRERVASAQLNSKYIKKLIPRPETSKAASLQDKFIDMFNQPKNLFGQVLSMQDLPNHTKKFFYENRVQTATTRSQTHKEYDQLSEIKDFKQIMEENIEKKQNKLTFATIDRAKTANQFSKIKSPQSLQNLNPRNKGQLDISDFEEIENTKKLLAELQPEQQPKRAGTATNIGQSPAYSTYGDVHSHLRKLMSPRSAQNLHLVDKPKVSAKSRGIQSGKSVKIEGIQNNFFKEHEEVPKIQIVAANEDANTDSQHRKKSQSMKDKLEIDLQGKVKPNQLESQLQIKGLLSPKAQKSQEKTPKPFNSQAVTPHSLRLSLGRTPRMSGNNIKGNRSPATGSHQQQSIEREEVAEQLDVNSDELTKGEFNYMQKKHKLYFDDIKPHLEKLRKEQELDQDMPSALFNKKDQSSYLLNQLALPSALNSERQALIITTQRQLQPAITSPREYVIGQKNIAEPEKCFYDNQENIHDLIKEYGQELRDKFDKYSSEDQLDFKRFQQKKEQFVYNFLNTNEEGVSMHELNLIQEEYKKPSAERDYDFLDGLAARLKFFKRFTKPTRLYLLKLANIQHYATDEIIFNQGDEGDLMYIIIRGACHVRIKHIKQDGQENDLVVATLYDGMQFGELALMNAKKPDNMIKSIKMNDMGQLRLSQIRKDLEKQPLFKSQEEKQEQQQQQQEKEKQQENNLDSDSKQVKQNDEDLNKILADASKTSSKRAATIQTCESTVLFTVSRDYFKTVLLGLIQKELDVKLKLLQSLSFFEYLDPMSFIPIANLIEVKKFKLGEIILREGEDPHTFYIVSQGRLKIIKEELVVRDNYVMGREHKFSKKNFLFGKKDYTEVCPPGSKNKKNTLVDNEKEDLEDQSQQEVYVDENEDVPLKSANYEIMYQDDKNIAYQYQVNHDFGSFVRGDFFFGRSLLLEYLKVDPAAEDEYSIDPREKAKLTVIADSAECEVYVLEKHQIHLIPNVLRRTMIDGLLTRKEYDSIYTKDVNTWTKQWDKYKSNMLQSLKKEFTSKKALKS